MQGKSYGFLNEKALPAGDFQARRLDIEGISWASTGDFSGLAHNHCGAVLITNLVLYFSHRGAKNLLDKDCRQTFISLHKKIGNGPVVRLLGRSRSYFRQRGYVIRGQSIKAFDQVKESIDQGRPLSLLLRRSNLDWHWVLVVGYRQYKKGENYYQIIDGWKKSSDGYYQANQGARLIRAYSYSLEKL